MKTCTKCGIEKQDTEFKKKQVYKTKSGPKITINNLCVPCTRISAKESKERHPYTWIKTKFKVSEEEAEFWYKKSRKYCEICGIRWEKDKIPLCVDHDHSTNEIRGILCKHCNHVLGHARDNIKTLENAIKYLRRAG